MTWRPGAEVRGRNTVLGIGLQAEANFPLTFCVGTKTETGCWAVDRQYFCTFFCVRFFFSFHSGVLDNSGGKILVRKVAGQSGYKGSYAHGVQSLSLPRWRESFIISGMAPPRRRDTGIRDGTSMKCSLSAAF